MISLFQYYRIVAAFLILLIHQQFWTKPLMLDRLTGVAVPLFAAMAGFLFAKSVQGDFDLKNVIAKKARRILIPYVIWAGVYWIANCVILDGLVRHESITVPGIRGLLLGGTACHLWFLPCLFVAFVFIGGCSWLSRGLAINVAWFVGAVLVASAATQFVPDATSETLGGYVKIYFGRLLFFFTIGFLLSLLKRECVMSTCIVGLCLVLVGGGNVMLNFIDGLVWSPLLLVVGLILVAQAKPDVALPKWIGKLADASMGIYLVHVLFTSGVNFALQKSGHSPLSALVGFALSIMLFAVSYLSVRLLPKKCF